VSQPQRAPASPPQSAQVSLYRQVRVNPLQQVLQLLQVC